MPLNAKSEIKSLPCRAIGLFVCLQHGVASYLEHRVLPRCLLTVT